MSESRFQELYKNLNPKQREAVDAIDGPVMVIAGPGTGKTSILTLRIANILARTDTSPDSILALTFTESGVRAMRKKLVDTIGPLTYRLHIHTFHSFANEIIKRYPQEFPRIIGSQHVTDVDQIKIMEKGIDGTELERLKPPMNPYFYLRSILSHIRELKREDIDPALFEELIRKEKNEFDSISDLYYESGQWKGEMKGKYKDRAKKIENNGELLMLYRKYQQELQNQKLYDYEDMIMEVVRVFQKNKDVLLRVQEEYQYVLADEHQDANNAQNKLLELISGFHENPNLFIVGDEKQAIFRFQGASLENFLYFKKKYPNATLVRLEENYRSDQTLLDAIHTLIGHNHIPDQSLHTKLHSVNKVSGAKIKLVELGTPDEEYIFLENDIASRIKMGTRPESIAILYRNNKDVLALKSFFDRKALPSAVHSDSDLFLDDDIRKFRTLLSAVLSPGEDPILAPILYIDFLGIDHIDAHRVIHESSKARIPLSTFIQRKDLLQRAGVFSIDGCIALAEKIKHWSTLARNKGLLYSFETIAQDSGFISHLISLPNSFEKLSLYDTLLTHIKNIVERHKDAMLLDFMDFLQTLALHDVSLKSDVGGTTPGRINLMTAHKSKGLEFEVVYIMQANRGKWGNTKKHGSFFTIPGMSIVSDEHEIDDERRLFYVALTRAKKEAIITRSVVGENNKETVPSQFIAEIDPNHIEKITPIPRTLTQNVLERSTKTKKIIEADVKDKTYLQELFLSEGLSVTALNNYLTCPWRYFFVNLIRIPRSQEKPQLYGTAIHETLKDFFDAYQKEEDFGLETTIKLFESYLSRKHLRTSEYNELLEKGKKVLDGYIKTYKNMWPRSIFNEFKIAGVFLPIEYGNKKNNLLLKGNLDKVEIISGNSVNVVDYKTGKPKTRNDILGATKSSDGNYGRQLIFYKLLLTLFKDGAYTMKTGEIDFIEPDEKGRYHKEKFEITDVEVKDLTSTIQKVASEILSLSFFGTTCNEKDCEYCHLASFLDTKTS